MSVKRYKTKAGTAWADERGSVVSIEFALIAPVLLGLLFGIMEVGRLMFTQAVLYFAVQETSRYALVNGPVVGDPPDYSTYEAELKQVARDNVIIIDPAGALPITTAAAADAGLQTTTVTITMNYSFEWMLPFLPQMATPLTLSASSSDFLVENVDP